FICDCTSTPASIISVRDFNDFIMSSPSMSKGVFVVSCHVVNFCINTSIWISTCMDNDTLDLLMSFTIITSYAFRNGVFRCDFIFVCHILSTPLFVYTVGQQIPLPQLPIPPAQYCLV